MYIAVLYVFVAVLWITVLSVVVVFVALARNKQGSAAWQGSAPSNVSLHVFTTYLLKPACRSERPPRGDIQEEMSLRNRLIPRQTTNCPLHYPHPPLLHAASSWMRCSSSSLTTWPSSWTATTQCPPSCTCTSQMSVRNIW